MAGIMDFFSPADLPGHLSYVLIAISYYATNIYWLRVTAVIGLALEILYFQLSHGAMHTGIVWNLVFILINIYQLHVLLRERIQLRHVTDLALLRQGVFATLGNAQLARLVQAGEWRNIPADTALTQQGQPVAELVLLCEGSARVEVDGVIIAQLQAGTFCGEMAFISDQFASATVIVQQPARAFVFDMEKLRLLVQHDDLVGAAMHEAVGRDLAQKIDRGNRRVGNVPEGASPA